MPPDHLAWPNATCHPRPARQVRAPPADPTPTTRGPAGDRCGRPRASQPDPQAPRGRQTARPNRPGATPSDRTRSPDGCEPTGHAAGPLGRSERRGAVPVTAPQPARMTRTGVAAHRTAGATVAPDVSQPRGHAPHRHQLAWDEITDEEYLFDHRCSRSVSSCAIPIAVTKPSDGGRTGRLLPVERVDGIRRREQRRHQRLARARPDRWWNEYRQHGAGTPAPARRSWSRPPPCPGCPVLPVAVAGNNGWPTSASV